MLKKVGEGRVENFLHDSNNLSGIYYPLDQYLENYRSEYIHIRQSFKAWVYLNKFNPKDLKVNLYAVIMTTHRILLEGTEDAKFGGLYRSHDIYIDEYQDFRVKLLEPEIYAFIKTIRAATLPLDMWKMHLSFVTNHYFVEGNGRLARIVHNWLRIKNGYGIKTIAANYSSAYYQSILRYKKTKDTIYLFSGVI